jgi:hypothetical protein
LVGRHLAEHPRHSIRVSMLDIFRDIAVQTVVRLGAATIGHNSSNTLNCLSFILPPFVVE